MMCMHYSFINVMVNAVAAPNDHYGPWHQPKGGDVVGKHITLNTTQQM